MIRRFVAWLRDRESRRWLDTPVGCCQCGTGGPYYEGDEPRVTRYVYVDACGDPGDAPDWASCSEHSLDYLTPIVDYGEDVVRTFRQTEIDVQIALARQAESFDAERALEPRRHCPCCGHGSCMRDGRRYGDDCWHAPTGCGPTCAFARRSGGDDAC